MIVALSEGAGGPAGCKKECIICYEREANQVLRNVLVALWMLIMNCDCRYCSRVVIRTRVGCAQPNSKHARPVNVKWFATANSFCDKFFLIKLHFLLPRH